MKTCFSTFACPTWDLRTIIEAADNHGFDGIELRCDAVHTHAVELWASEKERAKIKGRLNSAGLEVPVLATSLMMAADDVIEDAQRRIALAKDIGAGAIRVFCGNPGMPISDHEIFELAVENLRRISENAEYMQVKVLLETNDRVSTAAQAAKMVSRCERDNIGVVWNNLQTYRKGETVAESMAALKGVLHHVHFNDGRNLKDEALITPFGEGEMPIGETYAALFSAGYDGYLSGQWFYNQYGDDPNDALELYHSEILALRYEHDAAMI